MRFARVNGIVLHYALKGSPDAPVLVFANSLGTDFRIWSRLIDRLGARFRYILYDKRGHGLSDAPPAPYVLDEHMADLAGLLDLLEIDQAVLVGLSIGGMIAQGLAASRPNLVRGLVLCDTAHKIGPPDLWEERIAAIREGGIAALAQPILERWFSQAFHRDRPEELLGWRNMLVRTPLEGYLGSCAAIRDGDMTECARAIRVPSLCLAGSEDGATPPELVQALAELIPGAHFEVVEGAGHLPCIEAPGALADLMMAFLEEKGLV